MLVVRAVNNAIAQCAFFNRYAALEDWYESTHLLVVQSQHCMRPNSTPTQGMCHLAGASFLTVVAANPATPLKAPQPIANHGFCRQP
jgi:hypothetical protein